MAKRSRSRRKPDQSSGSSSRKRYVRAGMALLILFVGAGFVLLQQGGSQDLDAQAQQTAAPVSQWEGLVRITTQQARHFKGDPDALVTILEFSDFQ